MYGVPVSIWASKMAYHSSRALMVDRAWQDGGDERRCGCKTMTCVFKGGGGGHLAPLLVGLIELVELLAPAVGQAGALGGAQEGPVPVRLHAPHELVGNLFMRG